MRTSAKWGIVLRWLYKALRPKLQEVVQDSTNTADDTLLRVADVLAGVHNGKSK